MAKTEKTEKTKRPTPEGTQVRMNPETHARMRTLARDVGVTQVALVRALSFATPKEYALCEQRRLAELSPPTDEP